MCASYLLLSGHASCPDGQLLFTCNHANTTKAWVSSNGRTASTLASVQPIDDTKVWQHPTDSVVDILHEVISIPYGRGR